jgi:hypothetical protein
MLQPVQAEACPSSDALCCKNLADFCALLNVIWGAG